jgi:hypothetical protein
MWHLKYDNTGDMAGYDKYDFNGTWNYPLPEAVNGQYANVTVNNVWIPMNLTAPSPANADRIIEGINNQPPRVMVAGNVGENSTYEIKITSYYNETANLKIKTVGIWLESGFHAVVQSGGKICPDLYGYSSQAVVDYNGSEAVIWNFSSAYPFIGRTSPLPALAPFPHVDKAQIPMVSTITFTFTGPAGRNPLAVAWVDTDQDLTQGGTPPSTYTWDAGTKIYRVNSVAGTTEVEAYTAKNELITLASGISGDYFATGGTLMSATDDIYYRDMLFKESTGTVITDTDPKLGIPADAHVEAAYLYWSGWYTGGSTIPIWSDSCSSFGNWTGSGSANGNTSWLSPTSNSADTGGDGDGFETTPNNAYADGGGNALNSNGAADRHRYYGYNTSGVPANSTIAGIEVRLDWWLDATSGTNNMTVALSWDGGTSWTAAKTASTERTSDGNPTDVVGISSDNWGHSWTASELNSTNFRVRVTCNSSGSSSSNNRDFYLDWIPVRITYTGNSRWSVSSGEFMGQGSPSATTDQRTITLTNSLNLSSYAPGTVTVSWDQRESGTLEPGDTLYYAFSGNGGATWSGNFVAFSDDSPTSPFTVHIGAYQTNNFKMRFFFNFDDAAEYVYIDNINISQDGAATVQTKVNRVVLTIDGIVGPSNVTQITADSSQTQPNPDASSDSWSYSCKKDVTDLVTGLISQGKLSANGEGQYTVGHWLENGTNTYPLYDVDTPHSQTGTTGYPLSVPAPTNNPANKYQWTYAGWSLVIIYTRQTNEVHQLYLYDDFRYVGLSTTLNFPISGFLAPSNTTGSRLTYFVGEGDNHYSGEYISVNGHSLSGTGNPVNNPFNSYSNAIDPNQSGIDIDTFDMSSYIEPSSSTATVVLDNGNEIYDLVYIVLSFRSEKTTRDALFYRIQ